MNVLLIVVDTLRADHLGCYGYGRNTSPNIDALAAESVVFDSMIASAIPTHPAFATINTGQCSVTHGIVAHGAQSSVPRTSSWLPSELQKAGYTTCAVDNLANWRHGYGRGYEFYIDPTSRRALNINCDNRQINERALPWLEQNAGERFFMFVHYWDPHTPYLPPRAYRTLFYTGDPCDPENQTLAGMEKHPLGKTWRDTWFNKLGENITDGAYVEALYDGEIRYCDEGVGRLLEKLKVLGLADETVVVLMGDHGEMMYRHKIFFDHHGLYDGNLHIPLMVRHPGFAPRRIPHFLAHQDLAPTLLDLLRVGVPEQMEGLNAAPLIRGESDDPLRPFVVSQECTWQMKWSIRTHTHKFILAREEDFYRTPMRELYDLRRDPNEMVNIVETNPETARTLERQLEAWVVEQMTRNGLTEDPLVAHGLTLGETWKKKRSQSS